MDFLQFQQKWGLEHLPTWKTGSWMWFEARPCTIAKYFGPPQPCNGQGTYGQPLVLGGYAFRVTRGKWKGAEVHFWASHHDCANWDAETGNFWDGNEPAGLCVRFVLKDHSETQHLNEALSGDLLKLDNLPELSDNIPRLWTKKELISLFQSLYLKTLEDFDKDDVPACAPNSRN